MRTKIISILTFSAVLLLVAGCNNQPAAGGGSHAAHDHSSAATNEARDTHRSQELSLNDGAKWQADESTRARVAAIIKHTENFATATDPDLAAHHDLAEKAQEEIDALIEGCRMRGAEHDALHLWLEPVMADVKSLRETGTAGEARTAARQLSEDAKKFNQFFN